MTILILQTLQHLPLLLIALLSSWYFGRVIQYYFSSLRDVPGPFFARFTRFWHLREVWHGTFPMTNAKLHRKYGEPSCFYSDGLGSFDD